MKDIKQEKMKGVALIVVIGILSLLAIIATYFAINMQLEQKAAANYLNSIKAKYLAEMGIQKTIADIRNHVKTDSYNDLIAYIQNYSTVEQEVSGIGTYQIFIGKETANVGEDEKINLNALDDTDSTAIDTLNSLGLSYEDIAAIIDYKDADSTATTRLYTSGGWVTGLTGGEANAANSSFTTLEEVKLVSGIDDGKYNAIKDSVTIFGPIIRGGLLAEYYDNITGSSPNVQIDRDSFVGKIIELGEICEYHWADYGMPGSDGDPWDWGDGKYVTGWIESHDAEFAGGHLLSEPGDFGMDTFGVIFEGYIEILPQDIDSAITFYTRSNDGSRLYIDGNLVVDNWRDQGSTEANGTYTFSVPGWHQVKLEYYDNTEENVCELKWNLGGGKDYIPAERLGYYPLVTHPVESNIDYNSAGIYKIISLAKVKTSDDKILAEKKISTTLEIFGTWSQTTKEEFYGAWFNEYDNYADGEIRNVTWLNSCPIDQDQINNWNNGSQTTEPNSLKLGFWDNFDEDVGYTVVNFKGGVYFFSKYWYNREYQPGGLSADKQRKYWPVTYNDPYARNRTMFWDVDGDGDNELNIYCKGKWEDKDEEDPFDLSWEEGGEIKQVDLNSNYYYADSDLGYDTFARVWEKDGKVSAYSGNTFLWDSNTSTLPSERPSWEGDGTLFTPPDETKVQTVAYNDEWRYYYDENNNGNRDPHGSDPANPQSQDILDEPFLRRVYLIQGGTRTTTRKYIYYYTATSGTKNYWQPEAPWLTGWLFIKGDPDDDSGYYKLVKDEDMWCYTDGDMDEVSLSKRYTTPFSCSREKTLGIISSGSSYGSYVDGNLKQTLTDVGSVDGIVRLENVNLYSIAKPTDPESLPWNLAYANAVEVEGAVITSYENWWDNLRVIYPQGFLVSTPLYAGSNFNYSSSDIQWGTISWTELTPANTDVELRLRTASSKSSLPTTDSGWSGAFSNGGQITNSGDWLQYKALLKNDGINSGDYTVSSQTPVLKDITITYLPYVEILYWRQETE